MHVAASNGHLETAKLLLSVNSTPEYLNSVDKSFGRTALTFAAMKGHLEIVKLLIDSKAIVNVTDLTGMNPHEVSKCIVNL